ncbi:MAG: hypothetical protein MJH09_13325, partial [Cetobacterium sp.]|nr:hypothetical protein [Cetobacterium sp.]
PNKNKKVKFKSNFFFFYSKISKIRAIHSEETIQSSKHSKNLTRKTETGVLKNSLIFQTVLALLFIFLTTFGGDKAGELYYKIYDMSTMSFIVPYFFLALSYIIFKKKNHISPFQAVKNPIAGMVLGSLLLILCLVSLIFSGYDISKSFADQMGTIELYYGGLLFFLLIGVVIKFFSGKKR